MCLAHLSRRYKESYIDWLAPYFRDGDHAITLTFRDFGNQYRSGYQPNYTDYNNHVRHYLNKVHRTFLGRTKNLLNCAYSFERNVSQNVHVHMILQAPHDKRIPHALHLGKLAEIWDDMKYTGTLKGIKIKSVNNVVGWLTYITKDLRTVHHDSTSFDTRNWHLAPRS